MINERIENRLYHYLTHKILETPGARLHAIGGIDTHIHIAASLQPNILVSDWVGKLKGFEFVPHQPRSSGESSRMAAWLCDRDLRNKRSEMGRRLRQ